MRVWKTALIGAALVCFVFSSASYAHPGRTDARGGHTCRTNCEKWGLEYGEYHYHNGSSSSSSKSSSKSSAPKQSSAPAPATSTPAAPAVPKGAVKVAKPSFAVYIHDQQIPNASVKYPVIEYKDITYFPMTWNYAQALGLELQWDAATGLAIGTTDSEPAKLQLDTGASADSSYATMPTFPIRVNGVQIDNANEPYPVLVYNDITYFPMTWHFAVEELGLTIKFENDAFYISK